MSLRELSLWDANIIQFPRLLAEIMATQDNLDIKALAEAMDLSEDDVCTLLDRAQRDWSMYTNPTGPVYAVSDTDLFVENEGIVQHESRLVLTERDLNNEKESRWALAWIRISEHG